MPTKFENYLEEKIVWKPGMDSLHPYSTEFEGEQYLIRLNDFPDEHLYTLLIDGKEIAHFDDWPQSWTRP